MTTVPLQWKCKDTYAPIGIEALDPTKSYTLQPVTHLVGPAVYAVAQVGGTTTAGRPPRRSALRTVRTVATGRREQYILLGRLPGRARRPWGRS